MKYLVFSLSMFMSSMVFSQSILNATSPDEFRKLKKENKKVNQNGDTIKAFNDPLPYGYIEEKDELWSAVTWEVVDMNDKINQIYHHSNDGLVASNLSLFEALTEGIKSGEIKEIYDDEYFKNKMDADEALSRFASIRLDDYAIEDMLNMGTPVTREDSLSVTDTVEVRNKDVEMFMVKGVWYIDRRLGEMKYRLLGLAVLGPDAKTIGKGIEGGDELLPLFWIWYPDARKTLVKYRVFNPDNNSSRVSYDDLLNARRFNSVIYRTENGKGSGALEEYLPKDSDAQIKESERIKNRILELENEMWNY